MHPEILRELTAQHGRDLREQAYRAHRARTVVQALRAMRRGTRVAEANEFAVPAIPDYVDGSFRTTGDQAAGNGPGNGPGNGQSQVPAARHAA
jgi:hypothetical protein